MMMIQRCSKDRGHSQIDWLDSYHTFSFADYINEDWHHFGTLRVINEDEIQPGCGFGMHPHRDMEIITYVVSGVLEHQDSMGSGSLIRPGEIQRMSAGRGIRHSEFNHSATETLHLLQIWILPESRGLTPSYEQKKIQKVANQLVLLGSHTPHEHAVSIHQSITLYAGYFDKNSSFSYLLKQRQAWLQLIKGCLQVNEQVMHAGDGMGIVDEPMLTLFCVEDAEFLFFEMTTAR